jgi:hypothetical protein
MIDIEELTIGQIREIAKIAKMAGILCHGESSDSGNEGDHPYPVGSNVFIRTVTHHYTGFLKAVFPHELVLTEVAWIPDDGRFSKAMKTGELREIEPFAEGEVLIGRGVILDCSKWAHKLPRDTK